MTAIGAAWRAVRDRFRAADLDTPELDARLLAEAALGLDSLDLLAHEKDEVPAEGEARLSAFAQRRLDGEPVARILGHQEFYGLDFTLNKDTLVPRPETELLVDAALEALGEKPDPVFLDLGTGSGCVAIAILRHNARARAVATDISAAALAA
ncbi:MAG TPA: HemK/PrmC family methyltransferase, partial [Devosiaceae bacterium]|nr:HemK/PrmC family methyltransferase [Devosiaceae bacterium]